MHLLINASIAAGNIRTIYTPPRTTPHTVTQHSPLPRRRLPPNNRHPPSPLQPPPLLLHHHLPRPQQRLPRPTRTRLVRPGSRPPRSTNGTARRRAPCTFAVAGRGGVSRDYRDEPYGCAWDAQEVACQACVGEIAGGRGGKVVVVVCCAAGDRRLGLRRAVS
jgi:hypothetical protein